MNRLELIRKSEKEYHDYCYEHVELFQPGSWLHKPVKTVLELLPMLEYNKEVNVLDLGSGVGRNSIPIAQYFKDVPGKVVCVDLLESAIKKLEQYSEQYQVSHKILPVLSDLSAYHIPTNYYQLIISVSALEHVDSKKTFDKVIDHMISGTQPQGINCMIISTGVKETAIDTGESIEPMYELIFETNHLLQKLEQAYRGWEKIKCTVKPYEIEIVRDDQRIKLESDVVTWVARKL